MKIQYLIWVLVILVINTACYMAVERPEQDNNNSYGGMSGYSPVITVTSSAVTSTTGEFNDGWNCGTEWIVIKNPDGSYAYIEINKICDPLQDIYKGCPSPLDN